MQTPGFPIITTSRRIDYVSESPPLSIGPRLSRRETIAFAVAALVPAACNAQAGSNSVFRPEDYGAKGDGIANDGAAFAALSEAVNRHGGGTVVLQRTRYLVGMQRREAAHPNGYLLTPQPILSFAGCAADVTVQGNGASLICAPGLLYGVFDPHSLQPFHPALPFYRRDTLATPYVAMVQAEGCHGAIRVHDLVLDGNVDQLTIGGRWGDAGWQIAGSGIVLLNNSGDELIENVICRNHPLDGLMLDDAPVTQTVERRLVNVIADRNGRQGASIVGGDGYSFENCRFLRTGRGPLGSAPGAGVDIEPENGKRVTRLRFDSCQFEDNAGPGLLAGGAGSRDVRCTRSMFVGTTAWAAWPAGPAYVFDRCTFIGATSNCHGASNPADATRFAGCTFCDTALSGSPQRVFHGSSDGGPIVDVSTAANVRFSSCTFSLTEEGRLPWSTAAIYENCVMTQRVHVTAYPRGTWLGRSTIRGIADVGGSKIVGTLTINGQSLPRAL